MMLMCAAGRAAAQDEHATDSVPSLVVRAAKQAVLDPTTYAPGTMLYVSSRLDWDSSQPFFQHGDVENNPRYTVSGLPHDVPLSYAAGNHLLLTDALSVLSISFANNAVDHLTVSILTERYPEHRKLWKTLGWVERAAVASSLSYVLSARHFEQWQMNKQQAAQLGY